MLTVVVNRHMDAFDVYIGSGTIWGNPYAIGKLTRSEVIKKYREWILTQPDKLNRLRELVGKRLGCSCAPMPCHGCVLLDLIQERFGGNRISAFELATYPASEADYTSE